MLKAIYITIMDEVSGEVIASKPYPKSKGMTTIASFEFVQSTFPTKRIYQQLERALIGSRFVVVYLSGSPDGTGRNGRNWDRFGIGEGNV